MHIPPEIWCRTIAVQPAKGTIHLFIKPDPAWYDTLPHGLDCCQQAVTGAVCLTLKVSPDILMTGFCSLPFCSDSLSCCLHGVLTPRAKRCGTEVLAN